MNSPATTVNFQELLERAGFHIRGRRADCIHCDGHSRLTVSFNHEVAFCHRCAWTRNFRTLSRELGVSVPRESDAARSARERRKEFEEWRNICQRLLIDCYRALGNRAARARAILRIFPDCEPAWEALAKFYHTKSLLCAALDILCFEKVSPWLERAMTREKLAAAFDEAYIRCGKETDAA